MTDRKLDSVILIDGVAYSITAEKTVHSLTIKKGEDTVAVFDGSEDKEITIDDAENANKIQVNMDNGNQAYATITISKAEPTEGTSGDIWFKYN